MERKRCFNILLILCAIAYGISSIFYLVDDYDLWRNCNGGSNLWSYVLVSLCLLGNKRNLIMDQDDKLYVFFYCSLIEIGLACWGGVELFDKIDLCTDLKGSGLYNMGIISFVHQLLIGGSSIIISFVVIILNCLNSY